MAPEFKIGERGDYFLTIDPKGKRLTTNSTLFGTVNRHIEEAAKALQVTESEIRTALESGKTVKW